MEITIFHIIEMRRLEVANKQEHRIIPNTLPERSGRYKPSGNEYQWDAEQGENTEMYEQPILGYRTMINAKPSRVAKWKFDLDLMMTCMPRVAAPRLSPCKRI